LGFSRLCCLRHWGYETFLARRDGTNPSLIVVRLTATAGPRCACPPLEEACVQATELSSPALPTAAWEWWSVSYVARVAEKAIEAGRPPDAISFSGRRELAVRSRIRCPRRRFAPRPTKSSARNQRRQSGQVIVEPRRERGTGSFVARAGSGGGDGPMGLVVSASSVAAA
jgi:hypothetical protein